ncbi:MAG: heliorhodopsin HeR [Acidimicrobiia bacterium]|nr:heliorhodopsin HeR [Acidimicrobiia bacterium]
MSRVSSPPDPDPDPEVTTEQVSDTQARRLWVLNVVVGLAHLAQAVLMVVLSNDLALPVTASFLSTDPVAALDPVAPETVFEVPIGLAVAAFLFMAAVDHLLMAIPGVRQWYERNLRRGINVARWVEYSVSASLMVVLIALFVGIRDGAALLGLAGANSAMILFGLLMERERPGPSARWSAFWFGCIAGAVPWVAIWWYIISATEVPGFVLGITVVQLVLFCAFAVNQALQYAQVGAWRSYAFGEAAYIVLSLVAKSLLAWIIFVNVLRT